MDNAIGGYFELELPRHEEYHKGAIQLNSGKNCIEYILRARKYNKVYIPYYTCDVVLKPFQKTGTEYAFYHINFNFELAEDIYLQNGEAILYTNYYGLKQGYAEQLTAKYGQHLIVDNSQAFFARPISGIDTFYTCRKFFGVPDGAYLYCDAKTEENIEQDFSYDIMDHLLKRIDISAEEGFHDYHKNEKKLESKQILKMSKLTERLMQSIDYEATASQRRENFCRLHLALQGSNLLQIHLEDDAVPMVYPYLTQQAGLREHLIANKVFVAKYWPNVLQWAEKESIEYNLTNCLIPIPVDQRYSTEEIKRIVTTIK